MAKFKTTVGFTINRQDGTTGTKAISGLNTAPVLTADANSELVDNARGLSAKNFAETIIRLVTNGLTSDTYAPSYYQERRAFADVTA